MSDSVADTCSIEGCDKKLLSRGWCSMHYARWSRNGRGNYNPAISKTPNRIDGDVPTRFWAKVDKTEDCWIWTGTKTLGYGTFGIDNITRFAHRVAYELERGPLAENMRLLHRCSNSACVRPEHLLVVRVKEKIPYTKPTEDERFWRNIHKTDGCWEWIGGKQSAGYGSLFIVGRKKLAHRHSYELAHGPIAAGMYVDHTCHNPSACRNTQAKPRKPPRCARRKHHRSPRCQMAFGSPQVQRAGRSRGTHNQCRLLRHH